MTSAPRRLKFRGQPTRPQQLADYDRRRGSASSRGYDGRWAKAADGHRRNHPLCLGCEAEGLVAVAELVDHVVPHRGDRDVFWDKAMWQSSCRWHHDVVKQRLEAMWARGSIATSELWLNSATAVKLSRELREG